MNQTDIIKLKRLLAQYRDLLAGDGIRTLAERDTLIHCEALIEYIEYDLKNPENQP